MTLKIASVFLSANDHGCCTPCTTRLWEDTVASANSTFCCRHGSTFLVWQVGFGNTVLAVNSVNGTNHITLTLEECLSHCQFLLAVLALCLWILHPNSSYSTTPRNRNRANKNHLEICLSSSQKNRNSLAWVLPTLSVCPTSILIHIKSRPNLELASRNCES